MSILRTFIADDSDFIRKRLCDMLSEIPGVEVIGQADNGITALNSIRARKPDVAILDIRMPGKSGIEVLEELRKDKHRLTIMMLTNYPYPQYKEKCLALGANHFFDKSADFDKMVGVLKQLGQKAGGKTCFEKR